MNIKCPTCKKTIHLNQEYQYHAGFSNTGFLYCDSNSATLLFGSYNPSYRKLYKKHPWSLKRSEKKRLEKYFIPCPCGGLFKFNAHPKCPHCNASLKKLLKDNMHYIEVGKVIDADKENVWK